jgi:hypothetical protein
MNTQHVPPVAYRYRFGFGYGFPSDTVKHRLSILKSAREYRERRRMYKNYYEPTPFERLAHIEQLLKERATA